MILDAKGRVAMPAKYRDFLFKQSNGEFVVTADLAQCLLIYPKFYWHAQVEPTLVDLPDLEKQPRFIKRLFLGYATECEMNSQGRILLSPALRDFAHLKKNASLIGQGARFELWDAERWNKLRDKWLKEESDTKDVHEILARIHL